MKSLLLKARTAYALGIPNIARALTYRAGVRLGVNPVRRISANPPSGAFFKDTSEHVSFGKNTVARKDASYLLFGFKPYPISDVPPPWHASALSENAVSHPERDWWLIPDFDNTVGDIKAVWEMSRFDWVLVFMQQALTNNPGSLERLNTWLTDWVTHNPPYKGPNWKCGQEASIRVMHLAMAALISDQASQSNTTLLDLIQLHLQRISPTIMYAIAQDNNHGTSEAAALFIGGSWLSLHGRKEGKKWEALGRKWLENRAARLIDPDGSFSQYSLNYHRVMLDTFCMVEVWRQKHALPPFSKKWYERTRAATRWLFAMVRPENGDGPNLGANDGARLFPLTDTDYRDYRPSVQLAMALFSNTRAYPDDGVWNMPLQWLGVPLPTVCEETLGSKLFDQGGFAVLRHRNAMAMLRYPRFRFRPSQADALHLDFWVGGRNLLRDAGSYSYNTDPEWLAYFSGTASHNTVQFDDRDQMPRLSRFLFGDWLKTLSTTPLMTTDSGASFSASYIDGQKAMHRRNVQLKDHQLTVRDDIEGFQQKAVLRWRLEPGNWILDGQVLRKGTDVLQISATASITRIALTEGRESRYYLNKTKVPVLEVEVMEPVTITTTYSWA